MKISVVTPTFNQPEYLDETIRSLLRQTGSDIDWLVGQTACVNSEGAVTYTEKGQKAISREFVRSGYYRADLPSFNWLPQDAEVGGLVNNGRPVLVSRLAPLPLLAPLERS